MLLHLLNDSAVRDPDLEEPASAKLRERGADVHRQTVVEGVRELRLQRERERELRREPRRREGQEQLVRRRGTVWEAPSAWA